jgi:glycosyltransferase involved in cell wall biosynthesis
VAYQAQTLSRGLFSYLQQLGFENHVVAGPEYGSLDRILELEGVTGVHELPLTRDLTPARDLRAVGGMRQLLKRLQPDLVHTNSPKASLVTACCRPSQMPVLYMVRGLPLEEVTGWRRSVAFGAERFACHRATSVIYIGQSLRDRAHALGVVSGTARVLGYGSSNGVDSARFRPLSDCERAELLLQWSWRGSPIFGFVGRLTPAKGLEFLMRLWPHIRRRWPESVLLVVGAEDRNRPLLPEQTRWLSSASGVQLIGHVEDTSRYFQIMNVHLFPSLREGFGNVAIEAGACGVPTVASPAVGTLDSVIDGVTGRLVPRGVSAWIDAIDGVLGWQKEAHRRRISQEVLERFEQRFVWSNLADEYFRILEDALSSDL